MEHEGECQCVWVLVYVQRLKTHLPRTYPVKFGLKIAKVFREMLCEESPADRTVHDLGKDAWSLAGHAMCSKPRIMCNVCGCCMTKRQQHGSKVSLLLSDRELFECEEFGDMWNDVSLAKLT